MWENNAESRRVHAGISPRMGKTSLVIQKHSAAQYFEDFSFTVGILEVSPLVHDVSAGMNLWLWTN